jgi:uncharacterized DUF497 family protein
MLIVWDEAKNRANRLKHGVSFETARLVFDDPFHISVPDRHEHGEERWTTVGMVGSVVILVVVHTYGEVNGEEIIRIISARKATKGERERYGNES